MPEFIMKWFGWNCKWEFVKTLHEGGYNKRVYNLYKDTNKNGLERYEKVLINNATSASNSNKYLNG